MFHINDIVKVKKLTEKEFNDIYLIKYKRKEDKYKFYLQYNAGCFEKEGRIDHIELTDELVGCQIWLDHVPGWYFPEELELIKSPKNENLSIEINKYLYSKSGLGGHYGLTISKPEFLTGLIKIINKGD